MKNFKNEKSFYHEIKDSIIKGLSLKQIKTTFLEGDHGNKIERLFNAQRKFSIQTNILDQYWANLLPIFTISGK